MHDLMAVFELNLKNLASLLAKSGADTLSLLERRLLAAAQTLEHQYFNSDQHIHLVIKLITLQLQLRVQLGGIHIYKLKSSFQTSSNLTVKCKHSSWRPKCWGEVINYCVTWPPSNTAGIMPLMKGGERGSLILPHRLFKWGTPKSILYHDWMLEDKANY